MNLILYIIDRVFYLFQLGGWLVKRNLDVIRQIRIQYPNLSKSHKIIADYIINYYDKAAFMTAAALGEATSVSESTVVRFANKIGYEGYRDLQNDLRDLIKSKLTTVQRLNLANSNYNNYTDLISKFMQRDMDNIKKVINEVDITAFHSAIESILNAQNIYIVGLRSSSFLAGYLAFYLNFLFDNIKVINTGANDVSEQLLKINAKDAIIVITYPRYSKKIIDVLEYSKEKGTKIITITDSMHSPAANRADTALLASSDMLSFIDSLVAPMSLINAFIIALGIEKRDNLNSYFEELEHIWKKYGIYDEIDI